MLAVIIPVVIGALLIGFYAGVRLTGRLIPKMLAALDDRELTRVLSEAAKLRREQRPDGSHT